MKPYLWGPCRSRRGYIVENANDGQAQATFMFIYHGPDDHMPLLPHSLQGILACLEHCGMCGNEHQEHNPLPCLSGPRYHLAVKDLQALPSNVDHKTTHVSIGFVALLTLLTCLTFVFYVSFFFSLFFQKASWDWKDVSGVKSTYALLEDPGSAHNHL